MSTAECRLGVSYYLIVVCVPFFFLQINELSTCLNKKKLKFQNKKKRKKNDSFKSRRIVHALFTFL